MTRMTDLIHNSKTVVAIKPQTVASAEEVSGEIIDTQGFYATMFQISLGAAKKVGTFTVKESDDASMANATDVPTSQIIGDLSKELSTDKATHCINVVQTKRYLKLSATTKEASAVFGANAVLYGADIDGNINTEE